MRWLIATVQDKQSKLKVSEAVCSKPAHLNGRNIWSITQADLNCTGNVSRPCDSNGEWQYLQYNCLRADFKNAVNQTYSLTGNVTSAEVIKALSAVANVTEYKENRTSSELLNTT
ncbi:hypothetical protein DPMN_002388 [Dreissena polymorpha]|uniref:LRRCT domain-containing protein n=1 Tax=Dreissena polymorpha TaxID=45954 RepID=A0A9D4RTX7_DREPO|nr:hypothetical protein DPMN_002388 [Dreissena polymorpha]